jgi:hypothetical protein
MYADCGPIGGGSDYPTNVSLKFSAWLHAGAQSRGWLPTASTTLPHDLLPKVVAVRALHIEIANFNASGLQPPLTLQQSLACEVAEKK